MESQNPDTSDYILVQNYLILSGNEKIDDFICKMQFEINNFSDTVLEWIPYTQFYKIKIADKKVALKCLNNSQDHITKLLNEVSAYSTKPIYSSILKVYGISQDPNTKDYIIVLQYAEGGNFDNWISINDNFKCFNWKKKIQKLYSIVKGLKEIHQNQMVHRDFHTGNILFGDPFIETYVYISDMGLCGEVGNVDETKIYGVMPYVAPEVLREKPSHLDLAKSSADKDEFLDAILGISIKSPSNNLKPCITKKVNLKAIDSKIITSQHTELISKLIYRLEITDELTSSHEFKLLFRGSRDGFAHDKFHEICDCISCKVTIAKVKDSNEILG
ncbi:kinase-like protein [Rhizophagus irregularis]|nr:kinase-like protein [Rhizophagus irregularis]